jgi:hypothetical protein
MTDLTIREYHERALEFVIYGEGDALEYNALQFVAEAGEIASLLAKAIRDKTTVGELTLSKEAGDLLWSVLGGMCAALGFDPVRVAGAPTFAALHAYAECVPVLFGSDVVLDIAFACAGVGKDYKTLVLNDKLRIDNEDVRGRMKMKMNEIVRLLAALVAYYGGDIGSVTRDNLDKLADRKARGVLGGEGSER